MSDPTQLLTWAALLAKWTDFARCAVALPKEGEGGRLRRAVPAIIALQAVAFALGELESLAADERALGLDRAEILIGRHASEIRALWGAESPPPELLDVITDASAALVAARAGA